MKFPGYLIARTDPFRGFIGHKVGRESLFLYARTAFEIVRPVFGGFEQGIEIFPLITENAEVIESRSFLFKVPFTYQGGLVIGFLQAFRYVVLLRAES